MDYLDELENESVYIIRETFHSFNKPVLLYSIGKDSSVLLHLARKAFYPKPTPFPLLHIDTHLKFPEMIEFRDTFCEKIGVNLIVHTKETGINPHDDGKAKCCLERKTKALLEALSKHGFDAAFGGGRRDEEASRSKERVYSFRDRRGQWDPRGQRPEVWSLYNHHINQGESFRIFPLSNWLEKDIWGYIQRENIEINPLYFARTRQMIRRNGGLYLDGEGPKIEISCRYRTLGCWPCTSAIASDAETIPQIIEELERIGYSERSCRDIDHDLPFSMERKKREGYF